LSTERSVVSACIAYIEAFSIHPRSSKPSPYSSPYIGQ